MSTQQQAQGHQQTGIAAIKTYLNSNAIQKKFEELLGKKSQVFITSVMQIVASNDMLKNADPVSIYQSAAMAATLDLPLNNSLGFAYIVPYNINVGNNEKRVVAQFQIGYKGFKQLALRTGQFKTINATDVREGELKKYDRLSGIIDFNWIQNEEDRLKAPIIGYVSFFQLHNGYEQTVYMPIAKVREHAKKYSKSYAKSNSIWNTSFDDMALKTVTKLNLSKNAPLSVEMQNAIISDQGVIKDAETMDVDYVDNEPHETSVVVDKEAERVEMLLKECSSIEELEMNEELATQYNLTEVYKELHTKLQNTK